MTKWKKFQLPHFFKTYYALLGQEFHLQHLYLGKTGLVQFLKLK